MSLSNFTNEQGLIPCSSTTCSGGGGGGGVNSVFAGNGIQVNEPTTGNYQVINTGVVTLQQGTDITITPGAPGEFTVAYSGGGGGGGVQSVNGAGIIDVIGTDPQNPVVNLNLIAGTSIGIVNTGPPGEYTISYTGASGGGVSNISAGNGISVSDLGSGVLQVTNTGVIDISGTSPIVVTEIRPNEYLVSANGIFSPQYGDFIFSETIFPSNPYLAGEFQIPIVDETYSPVGISLDNTSNGIQLTPNAVYNLSTTFYLKSNSGADKVGYVYYKMGGAPAYMTMNYGTADTNHIQLCNFTTILQAGATAPLSILTAWFYSSDGNTNLVSNPSPVAGFFDGPAWELVITRIA